MIKLFLFSALILTLQPTHAQLEPEPQYVDLHAHVACFGINSECYINETLRRSFRFRGLQRLFEITEEEILAQGSDQHVFHHIDSLLQRSTQVKSSVLMAFDQVYNKKGIRLPDESPFYVPNSFVFEGTRPFPRLHFAASVHPYRPDALREIERVEKWGAMYIKLIPSVHKFQPNDPLIDPYWMRMAERQLPLVIHLDDEGTFGKQSEEYTGAYKIERALKLGVTVIAAHASSRGSSIVPEGFDPALPPRLSHYEQLKILAKKYPNLYIDISALPNSPHRRYQLIDVLEDEIWQGRMLYGSDFPLNHPLLQSAKSFKKAWGRWRLNGVEPSEFDRSAAIERRWDRDIRLKRAFGVPESAFLATETFLKKMGRLK